MEKKLNERKSLLREAEKLNEDRPKRRRARGGGLIGSLLTKLIIILFLLVVLLGGGYYFFTKKFTPKVETNISVITSQLTLCQELVTVKYHYSDIISIKKTIALSKSLSLIKYSGVIRIGIPDMLDCDYEIYNEGKGLRIKLPDVEILGNDITAQEVFDENQSIFVPIKTEEVFAKIDEAKEKTLEELISDGILNEARDNAKKVIQQIMLAAGFEEVIVV